MIRSSLALLSFALSIAACGAPTVSPTPASSGSPPAPPATTPPALTSAPPQAPPPPKTKTSPCSTTARCAKEEVCCMTDDVPPIEFCAAWAKPASEAEISAKATSACADSAPPEAKQEASSIFRFTVLACAGSEDCGADELCVLGVYADAPSFAACVKKSKATGSKEMCGRGACKGGKTSCKTDEVTRLHTCEPQSALRCGASSCSFPDVCCASRFDAHCRPYACSKMEGPAWACSGRNHCGDGQVCCLAALGQLGSRCAFSCGGEDVTPTCERDADCNAPSRCKALKDSPVAGVKACQAP